MNSRSCGVNRQVGREINRRRKHKLRLIFISSAELLVRLKVDSLSDEGGEGVGEIINKNTIERFIDAVSAILRPLYGQ